MAKIKLGAIVVDARGKLGGHVFSKNRGGAYMRTKVTPTNPQTTFQSSIRQIFATLSQAWSNLTAAQRESWNNAVARYQNTDVFGDLKTLSGKALYQKLNLNLNNVGEAIQSTPGTPLELDFSNAFAPTIYTVSTEFGWIKADTNDNSNVAMFATEPLTAGTKFVKNKLRLIDYTSGASTTSTDFYTAYVARYGTPAVGQNIYVGVKWINKGDGSSTPLEVAKATISAT